MSLPGCRGPKGDGCDMGLDFATPIYAVGWALAVSLLVYVVFKLLRRPDGWPVIGLGCGFWVLLWIVGALAIGPAAVVVVPIIAYASAAAVVHGRSRSSAHGGGGPQ